jgi:uncharacterized repeat protein (TIGR04076 family)
MKDVLVTVVSQEGSCGHGHTVGQIFRCGGKTPAGMCAAAYAAIYPTIRALSAGGSFSWAAADGSLDLACPDGANPVLFRLRAE